MRPKTEGRLIGYRYVMRRVQAFLDSPMPCVLGQSEDATHRIVRVRDRSPDKVFGIDQNGKCFLLPDRD
ncbi:MAG: hypothetical protein QG626_651 [Patescibacteria group bacterium]|jgi:hypothetical protein|nr:hypothetical protein [Patescibacteria group bacterium]